MRIMRKDFFDDPNIIDQKEKDNFYHKEKTGYHLDLLTYGIALCVLFISISAYTNYSFYNQGLFLALGLWGLTLWRRLAFFHPKVKTIWSLVKHGFRKAEIFFKKGVPLSSKWEQEKIQFLMTQKQVLSQPCDSGLEVNQQKQ